MNTKGQSLGGLIVIAVAIIIGAVFLITIAQSVGDSVNTVSLANESYTAGANGEVFYITEYKSISSPVIRTAAGVVITDGNYTIENNVVYNGAESISVTVDDAAYESQGWNVSGTVQPLTYINESGGRAMANLIVVMFALAILGVVLTPVMKEGLKNFG